METNLETKQSVALVQGEAFKKAAEMMSKIADQFAQTPVGDYVVTLAVEKAEGMYTPQPAGDLQWQIPSADQNLHLEVAVQDKEDLRFLPELKVHAKIVGTNGNVLGEKIQPFLWHPFLYHYGANWHIPAEDDYIVEIKIEEPSFDRHDQNKGKRYQEARVEFGPLKLKPGRKEYGPE